MSTELTFADTRHALNLKQSEFAKRLGITRSYLSSIESGKREPSENLLLRLNSIAESMRATADNGANTPAGMLREVPVVSWASAGTAGSFEEIPSDWQNRIPTNCPDERAFALALDGDSMEPNFRPSDIIVVMPSHKPRSNGLVAARLTDRGVRFKMLTIRRGSRPFHLSSYNSSIYPPEDLREADFDWIYPVYEMRRLVWK
jgi:phage repressor protein C with HTH and peptisase S24 domain